MLRRLFTFVPILFLAGSALLTFLIILSGATHGSFLTKLYWIQADTSSITSTTSADFATSRWTSNGICNVDGGSVIGCIKKPAYPFSPEDNFGDSDTLPSGFVTSRKTYYYLTRFAYAFWIVGLFFTLVALLGSFGLLCGTGRIIGFLSVFSVFIAFIFIAGASSFQTSAVVLGHKQFKDASMSPKYGVKLLAFAWTSTFLLIVSLFSLCCASCFGGRSSRSKGAYGADHEKLYRDSRFPDSDDEAAHPYADQTGVVEAEPATENNSKGIKFFKVRNAKTNSQTVNAL
ncbi:hypothetical protein BABINDRAFT_5703 [Babjeviella inositovora NRRL Y-12698]|uniref:Uncharacterized protein n=1 Tax=Babjeviella inositovora NRRL Y-12698 TaxID=984486 RepID=A0A1E3QYU0_9ASCO|nr:uncharacterized protein BABINDRAFT_5703 [Babjeviella inositovora NRRL Y-12698]ODQ82791.1 hypothetical protein BABINDRAFT_5703 [Babjeviella inositovora NRRL Y-12698]